MVASKMRVFFGFLIAPGVPALVLYVLNLYFVPRHDAEFGGVILGMLGYAATLIVGIPTFLLARRSRAMGLLGYSTFGALVGLISYVLIVCVLLSSYQSPSAHAVGLLRNSAMSAILAVGYAATSSALFWFIAIRTPRDK